MGYYFLLFSFPVTLQKFLHNRLQQSEIRTIVEDNFRVISDMLERRWNSSWIENLYPSLKVGKNDFSLIWHRRSALLELCTNFHCHSFRTNSGSNLDKSGVWSNTIIMQKQESRKLATFKGTSFNNIFMRNMLNSY